MNFGHTVRCFQFLVLVLKINYELDCKLGITLEYPTHPNLNPNLNPNPNPNSNPNLTLTQTNPNPYPYPYPNSSPSLNPNPNLRLVGCVVYSKVMP